MKNTLLLLGFVQLLAVVTALVPQINAPPRSFSTLPVTGRQFVDRNGQVLNYTYRNEFNVTDLITLSEIPPFLLTAVINAEDKRFYSHHGYDLRAIASAIWQNLFAGRVVRGASTISEQSARILNRRGRGVSDRLLLLPEAALMERYFSKEQILELYLNQVPYASNRRGVVQGARYYFGRSLSSLNRKELLALAVLIRAPSAMNPRRNSQRLEWGVSDLLGKLVNRGILMADEATEIMNEKLSYAASEPTIPAENFVRYVKSIQSDGATTLDGELQIVATQLLERRVSQLRSQGVTAGAILAVDHLSDDVLVWTGVGEAKDGSSSVIDPIVVPRQPGSTLKTFLYGLALERGWTPETVIDDTPITKAVGAGLHSYRNYSNVYYGPVTLRQALGNSLNTPAIRTALHFGTTTLLEQLRTLGFESLTGTPDYYGEGLALGNGEVTLLELIRAYAAVARGGVWRNLRFYKSQPKGRELRVYSAEVSSLLGDILSDRSAREWEFSEFLNFPLRTAVKTGTSTGYHDAWAVGFSERFTVGVWLGDLERREMTEVSGASGAMVLLRAVFNELRKRYQDGPVVPLTIATNSIKTGSDERHPSNSSQRDFKITFPTPGLIIALDPRIPDHLEAVKFEAVSTRENAPIQWYLNEVLLTESSSSTLIWYPKRGRYLLKAVSEQEVSEVGFTVR